MKLRAILEGRWYTGRNAHQIWAEWAVWARWQILNGSQFLFHFNDKWLSVDNISWIYYQICLDKIFLLIYLRDCCDPSEAYKSLEPSNLQFADMTIQQKVHSMHFSDEVFFKKTNWNINLSATSFCFYFELKSELK